MIYLTNDKVERHVGIEVPRPKVYLSIGAFVGAGLLILAHVCAIIVYVAVVLWK